MNGNERSLFATSSMHACTVRLPLAVVLSRRPGLSHSPSLQYMMTRTRRVRVCTSSISVMCTTIRVPHRINNKVITHTAHNHTHTHTHCGRSCVCETCDPRTARWLDHLRARATSLDADSMPELGHGLGKPWQEYGATARHYLLESRTCHILPASSPSSSARARRYLMHVSRSATLFRYPT